MKLICFFCRKLICKMRKLKGHEKFEEVYDFCPSCSNAAISFWETQMAQKRLTTRLRIEK